MAALIERHRPLLASLCRRALADPIAAEDAVHEAILQALLSLDRLRSPERFGPWLAGIGVNVCRRWLRERSRPTWSWEALQVEANGSDPGDGRAGPEAVVEVADLRERVRLAMDDLPPGQRAAVELFYVADRSYAETAERLGIGVGAVKTRLHKARTRLRRQLSTLWKEEIMATATKPIEMRCIDVRMEGEESDGLKKCVVVLQEVGGPQRLYIWVGQTEATAIAYLLEQEETPRPLTIAFAANLVRTLGGRLQEVRISRLEQEVFYAAARLEGTKGAVTVDARPSDAIALALSLGAPIRVEPAVLAATGITPEQAAAALEKAQFQERQGASQIVAEATERWRRGHTGRSREPEEKP